MKINFKRGRNWQISSGTRTFLCNFVRKNGGLSASSQLKVWHGSREWKIKECKCIIMQIRLCGWGKERLVPRGGAAQERLYFPETKKKHLQSRCFFFVLSERFRCQCSPRLPQRRDFLGCDWLIEWIKLLSSSILYICVRTHLVIEWDTERRNQI